MWAQHWGPTSQKQCHGRLTMFLEAQLHARPSSSFCQLEQTPLQTCSALLNRMDVLPVRLRARCIQLKSTFYTAISQLGPSRYTCSPCVQPLTIIMHAYIKHRHIECACGHTYYVVEAAKRVLIPRLLYCCVQEYAFKASGHVSSVEKLCPSHLCRLCFPSPKVFRQFTTLFSMHI